MKPELYRPRKETSTKQEIGGIAVCFMMACCYSETSAHYQRTTLRCISEQNSSGVVHLAGATEENIKILTLSYLLIGYIPDSRFLVNV
jgi:hypothetical protein